MKYIKILLIGLLLVGFAVSQDPAPQELDKYEAQLTKRYQFVIEQIDIWTLEKTKIEYAFKSYRVSKDTVAVEPEE